MHGVLAGGNLDFPISLILSLQFSLSLPLSTSSHSSCKRAFILHIRFIHALSSVIEACRNLFPTRIFQCLIDEWDRVQVHPSLCALQRQRGTEWCARTGERSGLTRAFQAQTGVVEETPTVDLSIISIFLFPFTAALLSREGSLGSWSAQNGISN